MRVILKTSRLLLREMTQVDYLALCQILQDPLCMYAYEHAFADAEALEWLNRQLLRYKQHGFGLWAVVLRGTGEMIGQCGLSLQDWPQPDGRALQVPEIGYLFARAHWHNGYATEAAAACKEYAFQTLNLPQVFSIIRDTNTASQAVAKRLGMSEQGRFVKHCYGVDMPHIVFGAKR